MARHLDLSKARAMVRSFDDPWAYRLGPALLSPLRYPIDLWPPPPSPQADVTGRFPLTALAADALTIRASVMSLTPDDTVSPPSAGLESDWRVQTAMRMELHTARSVRMSSLSNTPTKLQSCESTQMEDSEILVTPLPRISTPTDLDTNLDTSALHTVSQRSSPPSSPSLAGSVHTSLDLTVDGIETPTFYTLPPDPLDALEALEALAALQPLCPDTIGEEHLDPIEALLWSPRHDEVHPFRALPRAAQYTSSEWCDRPPPVPPKSPHDRLLPSSPQRRSLDIVKSAGTAAAHRRAESTPTWPQAVEATTMHAWNIAQVQPAPKAAGWAQRARPPGPGAEGTHVQHFHHHHYHHHHKCRG